MRTIVFVFCLFFSLSINAAQYTGAAKITKFRHINGSGNFVIMGEWDKSKTDGCTNLGKWVVGTHSNYSTPESVNAAFSLIMAAYMADKTVELYVDGCNTSGQPIVSSIWFPNRY